MYEFILIPLGVVPSCRTGWKFFTIFWVLCKAVCLIGSPGCSFSWGLSKRKILKPGSVTFVLTNKVKNDIIKPFLLKLAYYLFSRWNPLWWQFCQNLALLHRFPGWIVTKLYIIAPTVSESWKINKEYMMELRGSIYVKSDIADKEQGIVGKELIW